MENQHQATLNIFMHVCLLGFDGQMIFYWFIYFFLSILRINSVLAQQPQQLINVWYTHINFVINLTFLLLPQEPIVLLPKYSTSVGCSTSPH